MLDIASIFLIRHGQASFGSADYDQLSQLGCCQAQVLSDYFSDIGIRLDAVYSGTLKRQRQTAEIATASQPACIPFHNDPRLNEIKNDEQFKFLLPQLIKRNPPTAGLVERPKPIVRATKKFWNRYFNCGYPVTTIYLLCKPGTTIQIRSKRPCKI